MAFCTACGEALEEGARFCVKCGKKQGGSDAKESSNRRIFGRGDTVRVHNHEKLTRPMTAEIIAPIRGTDGSVQRYKIAFIAYVKKENLVWDSKKLKELMRKHHPDKGGYNTSHVQPTHFASPLFHHQRSSMNDPANTNNVTAFS